MRTIIKKIHTVIEPNKETALSCIYDGIMLIAIIIGVFPLMFRTQYPVFDCFDIISGACFIIDYILRWTCTGMLTKGNKIKAFFIYPLTPMAIIDLLSILPAIHMLTPIFKIARIPRLLKILRIMKVIRYFEPLELICTVIKKQQTVLLTVLSLAMFYIFITALIMFNAEEDINPETGKYLFENFFDAFYWAACTLTTVGYGDLCPISETGRIISIISAVVGIAIIALPSGIITAGYLDEIKSRKEQKEQMMKNNCSCTYRDITEKLYINTSYSSAV